MVVANAATAVTPVRMLALFAAPLVEKRGNDLVPIPLLPVQEELETLADTCRNFEVALEIQANIATAERIGGCLPSRTNRSICSTFPATAAET